MTNADIDNTIVERVMGWTNVASDDLTKTDEDVFMFYRSKYVLKGTAYRLPHSRKKLFDHSFDKWSPTTSEADAFEVVDKMLEKFDGFSLRCDGSLWTASFFLMDPSAYAEGCAKTRQEAICKAAISFCHSDMRD